MVRVLLTGATGFLGAFLEAELRRRELDFVLAGRNAELEMDLAAPDSIAAALRESRADLILNAAAWSTPGECARDPAAAKRINGDAVGLLAGSGLRMLQVSTDLVFSGLEGPYLPTAEAAPLHEYGASKRAGELAALESGALVIRLPLLFGRLSHSSRGASGMLRESLEERRPLGLFVDEYRTPLHAGDAARILVDLLVDDDLLGLHHLAGPERLSRWEFGQRFLSVHGLQTDLWSPASRGDGVGRAKDVSLISDWRVGRSLDAALAEA